jgi:hypothetical protein
MKERLFKPDSLCLSEKSYTGVGETLCSLLLRKFSTKHVKVVAAAAAAEYLFSAATTCSIAVYLLTNQFFILLSFRIMDYWLVESNRW